MHLIEVDKWILSFEVDALFKRVCNESLYVSDRSKEGYTGSDDLNMGDMDWDVFLDFYKVGAGDVWNTLHYLCVGREDCFLADDSILSYTLYTRDNDPNIVSILDDAIRDYIVFTTLANWFGMKGIYAEEGRYKENTELVFRKIRTCKDRFNNRTRRNIRPLL